MHRIETLTSRLLVLLPFLILILPAADVAAADATRAAAGPAGPVAELPATPAPVGYVYTIQAGDTLWDIAAAHHMTVETLLAANAVAEPRLLRPGDRIFVPAAAVTIVRQPPQQPPARPTSPGAAVAPVGAPLPEVADWAALIVQWMNERRSAAGLAPLAWSSEIAAAAQAHAEDCRQRGWGSHEGTDGARIYTRLARAGYTARWAGENWAHMQSPHAAFTFWWNEPPGADPHRSNILNPMYQDVGIGIVKASWGYFFFVDFGGR